MIQLEAYSIDNILFLAGFWQSCATLLVETGDDLLQFVDCVLLDGVSDLLRCHIRYHCRA